MPVHGQAVSVAGGELDVLGSARLPEAEAYFGRLKGVGWLKSEPGKRGAVTCCFLFH